MTNKTQKVKKHKNKYVKFRHKVVFTLLRPLFALYFKLFYNYSCQKYSGKDKNILVVSNHAVTLDPFFLSMSFKFPIYYVASDQIFNLGILSKIMCYLVSPIAKMKGVSDLQTIKDIVGYMKEGGSVGLFPEGNRTFTGLTCTIPPQIGKLIKLTKKTVVVYNLKGGYLSKPRWGTSIRRGKMRGEIKTVWTYDDYKDLTPEQIYENLKNAIFVDANIEEEKSKVKYKTKRGAEYLEHVLYFCPVCHKFHSYQSVGNQYTCKNCGQVMEYTEYGTLETVKGEKTFSTINDWFCWQNQYIIDNKLWESFGEKPIFVFPDIKMYLTPRAKKRVLLDCGTLLLYRDRVELLGEEKTVYPLSEIMGMAVQTMGKMQLYEKDRNNILFISKPNVSLLSFMIMYYMLKNANEGGNYEFLGL